MCLTATKEAVSNALSALAQKDSHAALSWPPSAAGDSGFTAVWAGYAGCARPPDHALLFPHLKPLLGPHLRLTGDAELLVAPLAGRSVDACVTLICGTGSLGLLWRKDADGERAQQVARSGGWGPLLGDEGSGWSLGKAAVKSVLTFSANNRPLRSWHSAVLLHFGLAVDQANRLITACAGLDNTLAPSLADSERKRRIAACTRIAVDAARAGDDEAFRIVRKVASEVVDTLEPLVAALGDEKALLVVAGGLGQVDVFWHEVERGMQARGWTWDEVVKLADPGMSGLMSLVPTQ